MAKLMADADCEEVVNGVTVRMSTPECQTTEEVPFETQMLTALNELGTKSMDLYNALKIAFERNQKLMNAKTMTLSGNLSLTPTEHPPKEEKEPVVVPTIKIAASTAPCVEAAPKVTVQGADTKKAETKK